MKPTQEQVIAWAREAGVYHIAPNVTGSLLYMSQASLYRGFFLAYKAGRKDENEACAELCDELEDAMMNGKRTKQGDYSAFAVGIVAERIRARREQ